MPRLASLSNPNQVLVVRTVDVVYNGVDFLEVLDNELPVDSSYRQKILSVHLFLPVPTTLEAARPVNITITGGVRIPTVNVLWAISANNLIAGNTANIILPPDDGATILSLVQPALPTDPDELGHILVVRHRRQRRLFHRMSFNRRRQRGGQ